MKRRAVLAATAIACGAPLAAIAQAPPPDDSARPVGGCLPTQVCAFSDPEDLADLPGTPWLIVGESSGPERSGLTAFDTRSGAILPLAIVPAGPPCPSGGRGGGIGLRREGHAYRLVRIVHGGSGGGDAVETFRVTMGRRGPSLVRTGCIAAPSPYFLNDITPLPGGGFAATHMFDRAIPRAQREERFLAEAPTGYVVRWSPAIGWRPVPGSEGVFPNGIDSSPDGRWLAFAEIYGHALNRMRIDGTGRVRIRLAMQPDNVTSLGGARFLVAGGTGTPLVSTRRCPSLRQPGCGFPARAVAVDFGTGRVRTLATGGGVFTPGFSVGVAKAGHLYLGTAFGDRITILALGDGPATTP